jgi:hypothetical protein
MNLGQWNISTVDALFAQQDTDWSTKTRNRPPYGDDSILFYLEAAQGEAKKKKHKRPSSKHKTRKFATMTRRMKKIDNWILQLPKTTTSKEFECI